MSSSPGGTGPHDHGHNPYQPWAFGGPGAGPGQRPPSLDGISIAAMVCALTCIAAPVGIVLGIAGIVRTKHRRRKGRWAAVTGLIVGILATLGLVAGGIGVTWYTTNIVWYDEARAGDCVDLGDLGVWKADCDEAHDAEVLYSGAFDDESLEAFGTLDVPDFCRQLPLDERYDLLFENKDFTTELRRESSNAEDPDNGDLFLCLASRTNDEAIEERLLGSAYASGGDDSSIEVGDEIAIKWTDVGQCFDVITDTGLVEVVDCDEPHDAENFAELWSEAEGDFPGKLALEREGLARCAKFFESYVGAAYGESPHDYSFWYPSKKAWEEDYDDSITCVAIAAVPGEKLTGSVKDSGKATVTG